MQVRRLLSSAEPTTVRIGNAPEVGDPEMQALQQARLLALGMRTMTLPLGRGALTLGQTDNLVLTRLQDNDCLCETRPTALRTGHASEPGSHGLEQHPLTNLCRQQKDAQLSDEQLGSLLC